MTKIGMIGLPTDINSSYLKGPAKAPARIRELMSGDMMNRVSESGLHLGSDIEFHDFGDIDLTGKGEGDHATIQGAVLELFAGGYTPLCIGGDHSVSYSIVKGLGESVLLYDNSQPEGRFYCRTVEIVVETPIEKN
jgi:arginase family enzyme